MHMPALNTILLDLNRDMWGYISLAYFKQKIKEDEIGSSTMPHKVNPIDFENSEGNLGIANALLRHLSEKLPVSRWQRDLTDSTVLRNMGVALGHTLLAYDSCSKGLGKLEVNAGTFDRRSEDAWEVLAEPIQTVMRRHGVPEFLRATERIDSRQKWDYQRCTAQIHRCLAIPEAEKNRLREMTPQSYLGKAAALARRI